MAKSDARYEGLEILKMHRLVAGLLDGVKIAILFLVRN